MSDVIAQSVIFRIEEVIATENTQVAGFDYSTLDPAIAERAREVAGAIGRLHNKALADIGRHLVEMKAKLPHGAFLPWCQAELQMSPRSAQRAMDLARVLNGKSDKLSYLPATLLHDLTADAAPKEVLNEVVAEVEAGNRLPPAVVRHKLDVARSITRAAKTLQKTKPGLEEDDAKQRILRHAQKRKAEHATYAKRRREELDREEAAAHEKNVRASAAIAELVERHPEVMQKVLEVSRDYVWSLTDLISRALVARERRISEGGASINIEGEAEEVVDGKGEAIHA